MLKQLAKLTLMWGLLALTAWIVIGCRHNPPSTNPTTPFQQVLLWNQGLAESNQSVAKMVQGLAATTPPMIDIPTAQKVLVLQFRIAAADKKLTQVLEQGPEYTSGHAAQVNDFITDITGAATELINTGNIGVKDPAKQQQLTGLIQGLDGLAKLIVTGLQQAGVLKAGLNPVPKPPCGVCDVIAMRFGLEGGAL